MGHRIDIGHMGKRQGDGEQTRGAGHRDCLSVHTEHPVKTKNRRVRGIRHIISIPSSSLCGNVYIAQNPL